MASKYDDISSALKGLDPEEVQERMAELASTNDPILGNPYWRAAENWARDRVAEIKREEAAKKAEADRREALKDLVKALTPPVEAADDDD